MRRKLRPIEKKPRKATVRLTFEVNTDLGTRFEVLCKLRNIDRNALLEHLLTQYFAFVMDSMKKKE